MKVIKLDRIQKIALRAWLKLLQHISVLVDTITVTLVLINHIIFLSLSKYLIKTKRV